MVSYYIVTGIGRSGTSIICLCLNNIENCFCLNECPGFYSIENLKASFVETYRNLKHNHIILNRFVKGTNHIATDTTKQDTEIKKISTKFNENINSAIGSKVTFPYLNQIETLDSSIKCIYIIRHPSYVIQSWLNIIERKKNHIMSQVLNENLNETHFKYAVKTLRQYPNDLVTRLCILWNVYNELIINNITKGIFIRYEDFVKNPSKELNLIKDYLKLYNNNFLVPNIIQDYNISTRKDFAQIENKVNAYCLSKEYWGY